MGKKDKHHGADSSSSAPESAENIKVIVRCRPLNAKETEQGYKSCVDLDLADNTVTVHTLCGNPDRWTFDAVINNSYAQRDVFVQYIRPMVDSVLEGFNATVFAYGQSGSGKTHTMTGRMGDPDFEGIIPRTLAYIFQMLKLFQQSTPNKRFSLYVSFVELYNGKVRDLLAKQQVPLAVKENKDKTFFVQGAHVPQVKTPEDILALMEEGTERRQVAATELNADSSRSHSVFTIVMECTETSDDGDARSVTSKLNLVDLAGSERQSKTGATGDTLKEGCNINLSLSALGTVIDTLVKGRGHVPFRSSPLTMLLKDSLGGSSKTVMFANIGPSEHNISETISTLRFADRAKQIKNKPVINMDSKDQKIAELSELVAELREKLKQFETGGMKQLEEENESLKERVGELEVEIDNAIKSREADEVDQRNTRQHAEQERDEAHALVDDLKRDQARLLRDVQVLETVSADEQRQKEEILRLCADFLGVRPAAAPQVQPHQQGDDDGDNGTEDDIQRPQLTRTRSSLSAIRDVDELARLFREFRHGGGGGASGPELSKVTSALHTLEVEHRAALKAHESAVADLQRALDEAKSEATATAKKFKKAKELLADERDARKQLAAAAAAAAGGGGLSGVMSEETLSGPDAQQQRDQFERQLDEQARHHKGQLEAVQGKLKQMLDEQERDPRLLELKSELERQRIAYSSRIEDLEAEARAARDAATAPDATDSETIKHLKKLVKEQDQAAVRSRAQMSELENLVAALRENHRAIEGQLISVNLCNAGAPKQQQLQGSASVSMPTNRKASTTGASKKQHDGGCVERDAAVDRTSPQDTALQLHEVQARLHREQRDALRDVLETTAQQRNQLLMLDNSSSGTTAGDDAVEGQLVPPGVEMIPEHVRQAVDALTKENDMLRNQFLEMSRRLDDGQTTGLLNAVQQRRSDLHSQEASNHEIEGLRAALQHLTASLEDARRQVREKDAVLAETMERFASKTVSMARKKKPKQHQGPSKGRAAATNRADNSAIDEMADEGSPRRSRRTDSTPEPAPSDNSDDVDDREEVEDNVGEAEGDDVEEVESPMKSLVSMLQRDKLLLQGQVSALEKELIAARSMEQRSPSDTDPDDEGGIAEVNDDDSEVGDAPRAPDVVRGDEAESAGVPCVPCTSVSEPVRRAKQSRTKKHLRNQRRSASSEGLPRRSVEMDAIRTSGSMAHLNDQQRSAAEAELRQKLSILDLEAAQHTHDYEAVRAELEEERVRASQLEANRGALLEEVKALRLELAERERDIAAVENAMQEQSAQTLQIREDAAYHNQHIEDLERRVEDRSNQICELRSVIVQQKELIHEAQEQSNVLQQHVKEIQKAILEKDRQHALDMQEREETIMKATNRRLEALADDHQRDLQRKDEDVQKVRKKMRKMEAQLQKAKEKYDEKVCEYEELSSILEEQKVESMRLLIRAQHAGDGGGGGTGDAQQQLLDVQDQQEVIQSTLQRAKDEQRRKKDRFSMGENTSALSQVRAAGNAVNLVKKMGHIVVQHAPAPASSAMMPGSVNGAPHHRSSSSNKYQKDREASDDEEDENY